MDPKDVTGPDPELKEKAERLRERKAHGETLTRQEAGLLGALGAMEKGAREERRAAREGRHEAYEEAHRTRSWMKDEGARPPRLSEETKEEVEAIRGKQARGETLTRHEAGVLGGAARTRDEAG